MDVDALVLLDVDAPVPLDVEVPPPLPPPDDELVLPEDEVVPSEPAGMVPADVEHPAAATVAVRRARDSPG